VTVGPLLMRRFAASLLLGFCVTVPGSALGDGDGVALHVRTVLATDSGSAFDTRLDGYRRQLRGLFHYTSYRLVKQEDRHCAFGRPNNFEIPGGRYLEVLPVQFREDRLKLRVLLIEGTSPPPLDTDFTVPNRGNIWVGGPRNPDGTLLISIGAEAMQ
jgi:hypothetical protein